MTDITTENVTNIATHGWTAVPVDLSKHLDHEQLKSHPPKPIPKGHLRAPASERIKLVTQYAQDKLPRETFHHSMRVYAFGASAHEGVVISQS